MQTTKEKRVGHDEMNTLPYIIALDFDGTLVADKFPEIGSPKVAIVTKVKELQQNRPDVKFVLWTCRQGENLIKAAAFCTDVLGIRLDAVNENIREVQEMFGHDTRKVYANRYIDDKNILISGEYEYQLISDYYFREGVYLNDLKMTKQQILDQRIKAQTREGGLKSAT